MIGGHGDHLLAFARSFAPDGLPYGDAFDLSHPDESARAILVRGVAGGRFLAAWGGSRFTGDGFEEWTRAQVFSLCGNAALDPGEECEDGNERDDDCCSAVCRTQPFDGECWLLSGRTVLSATVQGVYRGRRVSCDHRCQLPARALLLLEPDGGYRIPGNVATCADGGTLALPDERGEVGAAVRRFELVPENIEELSAALSACASTELRDVSGRFRRSADGQRLRGMQHYRMHQAGRLPVKLRLRTRITATRSDIGPLPKVPRRLRGLPNCRSPLRLRCAVD
jgi:cysteine-rich repeat protein